MKVSSNPIYTTSEALLGPRELCVLVLLQSNTLTGPCLIFRLAADPTMSSVPGDDATKNNKMPEEQAIARLDSSEMATEVIDVDAAYLASSTSSKFYRSVLFQMILL